MARLLERELERSKRAYEISDEALAAMLSYDWPGNVRELENCIEQCCALNSGPTIRISDLPIRSAAVRRNQALCRQNRGSLPLPI